MLATVASINSANRLKKYLFEENAVSVKIIQTPSVLTKEGCGYSLVFDEAQKPRVAAAAARLRINIRSFFKESGSPSGVKYIKA